MGNIDEISKAFGMFTDGVRNLQLQRSLSDANDQVHKIRASELKEDQQMNAIRGVANELTLRLAGTGVNAATIEQVNNAFKPQQPTPFQQSVYLNQMTQQGQTDRLGQQQQFLAGQNDKNRANQKSIADANNAQKAKTAGKVEVGLIKELQNYDTQLIANEALSKTLKGGVTGPGLQNIPLVKSLRSSLGDGKFQEFVTQTNMYFDAYRRAVTGMAASQQELDNLAKTTPSVSDTRRQFEGKLKAMHDIGNAVRKRFLINLKKSGRNVDPWMQPGSGAEAADSNEIDAFHATAPDVGAPPPQDQNDYSKYF